MMDAAMIDKTIYSQGYETPPKRKGQFDNSKHTHHNRRKYSASLSPTLSHARMQKRKRK